MSSAYEKIRNKQVNWAKSQGLTLVGSKSEKGFPSYTQTPEENLFEPLINSTFEDYAQGDGGETTKEAGNPAKIQAVHSTAALVVNVFQYWQRIKQPHIVAAACGLCDSNDRFSQEIVFEEKFPILASSKRNPNLDVVIHNANSDHSVYAIECKFTEPFREQKGFNKKYMNLPDWHDIPQTFTLAKEISPTFYCLDAAQLIRHILALKQKFTKKGFKLLYLYYDVDEQDGEVHKSEINRFADIVCDDEINFDSLTYQKLITNLASIRAEHSRYVDYLTERYL